MDASITMNKNKMTFIIQTPYGMIGLKDLIPFPGSAASKWKNAPLYWLWRHFVAIPIRKTGRAHLPGEFDFCVI
jgi:hypothetical protein